MKCPHCRVDFHPASDYLFLGRDADSNWAIQTDSCSACQRFSFRLLNGQSGNFAPGTRMGPASFSVLQRQFLVYPKGSSRPPCPSEVAPDVADDYTEACLVLPDSAKAAAALGRRCLQHLLREYAKVKPTDLSHEIEEYCARPVVPSHISSAVDAVRVIGNFAAHPLKSQQSGQVLPVEPGEAEWTLDVLESLFDFMFVQPTELARKRDSLNKKLSEAGKPPLR